MHVIDGLGYGGGAEESLVASLPLLRARGIDSSVVCIFERPGWQDSLREQGFSVTTLPQRRRLTKIRALRRLIRSASPDLVHATLVEATLITRLASIGLAPTRVDSLVNITYDPSRQEAHGLSATRMALLRTVDALTSRLVPHFHVLTDAVAQEAEGVLHISRSRITRIPRGRDTSTLGTPTAARRTRMRSSLGISETDLLVLNVGRQDPQKAKLDLVAAFELVADDIDHAVLLIAGREGSDTPRLTAAVASSRHADRIRILGHRDDVPDLLAAADLFVFPSLYEGFGGVLIEAMAMGCPIIGSDAAAVAEVLQHGDLGLIVPRADTQALATAMVALLKDPARRTALSRQGMEHFRTNYSLTTVADTTSAFYRTVNRTAHASRRGTLARRVVNRLAPLVRNVEVLGISAQAALPADTRPTETADLRLSSAKSLPDAVALVRGSGLTLHSLAESRLHSGSTFWTLVAPEQVVASGWVSAPTQLFPIGELRTHLAFPIPSRVLYDFTTDPAFRNRGHYTAFLRLLKDLYRAENVYIFAQTTNDASLRGIRRAGFTHVCMIKGATAWCSGPIAVGLPT